MRQLIVHSLKMHRVQSASIIVSVALSVMILVTFGLVYGGVMQGLDASEKQGGADVMAIPSDALQYIDDTELLYTGAPAAVYMDESIVDDIASVDGAQRVSPQFYGQTLNQGCCSTTGETRLIGIEKETDFVVSGLVGEEAVAALDEQSVIIGSGVDGVYDNMLTIYDKKYTVVGVMAETGTGFDASIVGDIDMVRGISRSMEGFAHFWEKHGDPSGLVSCVMIDLDDNDPDGALTRVNAKINLSGVASPLVRSEVVDKSRAQLQSVFLLLVIAAALMAIVTLLQLFARFYSSVWDRKSELALYRAVGASKTDLRKLIVGEVGALVGVGLVAGIVLGFVAQAALLGVMQDGLAFPYVSLGIGPAIALAVVVVLAFALVSFVSIVVPLRQIGQLDPSAAMQQGDID
ncbi:MAG: FtsX-like permease family protein [Eggerthellaceae bacterium]|nr:FtsX-like permease family protein [Eggerthellaceae bacterium]